MKEVVINAIFGWLFRAPLLYNLTDWLMAISQIYVLIQGYKVIKCLTKKYTKKQKVFRCKKEVRNNAN